jgi:C-terminal processing protease CtpA/Prc
MSATRQLVASIAGLTLVCAAFPIQQPSTSQQDCEAPSYFGICDPYVPGIYIGGSTDNNTLNAIDTWPDGPAEKAGICGGDHILAVNGVPVPGHTFEQMLKEIVSPSPARIALKVKRGSQEMEFHFDRVRESTLAQLSQEKFMRHRMLLDRIRVGTVPLNETREELEELTRFCDAIDRRLGFKLASDMIVPEGTPEAQLKKLMATQFGGPEHDRSVGSTRFQFTENSSVPGFDAVLLKNPEEVLVNYVFPDSPAHHAGLFPGDQILEVNGHPVPGLNEDRLTDLILKPDEPREISLTLRRGASKVNLKIQTQRVNDFTATAPFGRAPVHSMAIKPGSYVLGFDVLYAENPREAMVDEIRYPSPAFDAGLLLGDRVLKINSVPIEQITPPQLREMLQPKGASVLMLEISRLGKTIQFQIKPATYAEDEAKIGRKITKKGPAPDHCPEG